jgi:lipopolysaccharide export system permease protein
MQILTRYVVAEFLKVLLVALCAMTAILVPVGVGREAVSEGLGLLPIVRLLPYLLPMALRFAVPGTVLLAATSVFGRMSAGNEIVALKSMGISPLAVLRPVFVLAGLISLAAVWMNDAAVSWGQAGIQRVVIESVEETAYGVLRTQKSWRSSHIEINVLDVEDKRLIQPTIILKPGGSRTPMTISADEARLHADLKQRELTIDLLNPAVEFSEGGGVFPGPQNFRLPLEHFSRNGQSTPRPSELALRDIPDVSRQLRRRIEQIKDDAACRAVFQMSTGQFGALADSRYRELMRQWRDAEGNLQRLRVEPYRRWANGLSCLCFALVGAPMAIRRRHGELLASFFACFLPILLVYYPFLMVSVDHAKDGSWPPQCVWLGNLVLVFWSVWLIRRVVRY